MKTKSENQSKPAATAAKSFVIYTMIVGRKNYIEGQFTRSDNSFLPRYHQDKNNAKRFSSEEAVKKYLAKVHNTINRKFEVEEFDDDKETSFQPAQTPKEYEAIR